MSTDYRHYDLHTHSTASDGSLTPSELAAHAAGNGIKVLALTDHDTVAGVGEARAAASRLGLRLIAGIEISVLGEGKPLHVVGLDVDPAADALGAVVLRLQALRRERAIQIGARLERRGIAETYAGACELAGSAQPGRVHFARHLVAIGAVADVGVAFERLLGRGKPAYVAASWPAMEEAVNAIRCANGVAVLAHPLRYQLSGSWRRRIAAAFKEVGGQAIEVISGTQSAEETAAAANLAEYTGLHASVGSDFHSPEVRWSAFGRLPALPARLMPVWELLAP